MGRRGVEEMDETDRERFRLAMLIFFYISPVDAIRLLVALDKDRSIS
jgi:hypothetical protein